MTRRRNRAADEFEPVVSRVPRRLSREPRFVKRPKQPLSAAIAGKHSPGPVRSVRGGSETDDQQFRPGIAEIGNGPPPVIPVLKRAAFLGGNAAAVVPQPGTAFAGNDLTIEFVPRVLLRSIVTLPSHPEIAAVSV